MSVAGEFEHLVAPRRSRQDNFPPLIWTRTQKWIPVSSSCTLLCVHVNILTAALLHAKTLNICMLTSEHPMLVGVKIRWVLSNNSLISQCPLHSNTLYFVWAEAGAPSPFWQTTASNPTDNLHHTQTERTAVEPGPTSFSVVAQEHFNHQQTFSCQHRWKLERYLENKDLRQVQDQSSLLWYTNLQEQELNLLCLCSKI